MTLIQDKPANLPSSNALDAIDASDGTPPPAEIRLAGKILTTLENPPDIGDSVILMVKLEVSEKGLRKDDEEVHYRKTRLVSCWKPGDKPPVQGDPNQQTLPGTDGDGDDDE